jgi:hypothetical protein
VDGIEASKRPRLEEARGPEDLLRDADEVGSLDDRLGVRVV